MKIKLLLALAFFLIPTVSTAAQIPNSLSASDVFALRNNQSAGNWMINSSRNLHSNSAAFNQSGVTASISNLLAAKCAESGDDSNIVFAPSAAACNGVSVTPIVFNNANQTLISGTDNTVNALYRYTAVGTAPDGTALDALVTVTNYSNNQDATPTTFRDADLPAGTAGFDQNLQPSLNQETATFPNNPATNWTGSITYRIQFVVASTNTPKVISVAATTIDNDGSNICGGLNESVSYSTTRNQILTSATTNQTVSGSTVTGPQTVQNGIGTGVDYANSALFVNVTELNWTYSFATTGTCAVNSASEVRYGSLNMNCQINFGRNFASVAVSGNVLNDTNGLTDSTVNGTGTGTPSGTQVYANLVDTNGFVVSSVAVAAGGAYSFPTVVTGNYTVQISTTQGVESASAPAIALPAGWVNTGENIGTAAGSDGTPNGSLAVTVGATAITNANFGIEQRPTANTNTATAQVNPGGTIRVTVPATTFTATDPTTATVSSIRITAFPSNANSLTVGTTTYYATTLPGICPTATCLLFPGGGVTTPTNAAGNPTQAILVDPVSGAVTVSIPFVAIDAAGVESSAAGAANVPFTAFSVSGSVLNDTNGLTDSTVNGTGTNTGNPLYANLILGGVVYQSVLIPAGGAYSFTGVDAGSYTVQVSTNQGTVGNAAPAIVLPAGWVNTGENIGTAAGSDGTPNGSLAVTVSTANIANANFGIEQRPTANNNTATSQTNPGGTTSATVPATTFSGTDATAITNIRITAFPSNANSLTVGTTTYYATTLPGTCPTATCLLFPGGGVTTPAGTTGNPTQAILVDPVDGAVTVGIQYVTIDAANVESTGATASVPFATVSISGSVLNDTNGLTDSTVNGTGTNAGGLFANLLDGSNNVVATATVAANGTYTITGLNSGSYTVQISTNQGTVGNAAPAIALPVGWVNTGENIGTAAGSDGTPNGLLAVTVGATSVTNANFGIEQRPTANNNTATTQGNPGGTNNATVPATTFSGADAGTNTVSSIRISTFPTNATTITINGTVYGAVAGPGVTAFPAGGVTTPTNAAGNPTQAILVDPVDGAVTVVITYFAIDAAGVESSASATASVPFATLSISGNVFNDTNGLNGSPANTVDGTGTNAGGLFANLLDSGGNVVQSVAIPAGGTYSFSGLNGGNYSVQISTNAGTAGNPAPATALPAGWVNTGEFLGTGAGNDGVTNGLSNGLLAVTVGATNVTNANFGIEQRPTANSANATSQTNPGGTTSATVPATTFSATDPTTATVSSIRITAFPSNANSLTVGTTTYYATTLPGTCPTATCLIFPGAGVTTPTNAAGNPTAVIRVDPVDGGVIVNIPYVAIDAAGVESSTAATAGMPFFGPTAANGDISGALRIGRKPIRNALVVLTDTGLNSKVFTRTDNDGNYVFSDKQAGRTYIIQPLSDKYSFSPSTLIVNLLETAEGQDFNSTTKVYHPKNDFDGDGKTDIVVFRPNEGNWYVLKSSDGQMSVFHFGMDGDIPAAADYDGDGKTDYAVFRPSEGIWYIWQSATQQLHAEPFGAADDKIVPADFDGDGKADIAVYRSGNWYVHRSSDNAFEAKSYGDNSDTPIAADFDGDRKTDFTVFRPAEGMWFTLNAANNSSSATHFGQATDVPVAGDFDGDGVDDIAQFRSGYWYILNSTTKFEASQFGTDSDRLVVGDYDGDGRSDLAIYRNGLWAIKESGSGIINYVNFGSADDVLVK